MKHASQPRHPPRFPQRLRSMASTLAGVQRARGKGIGRTLIRAVYEQAQRAGSPRVYWHTHETNSTAMRFYDQVAERSGFIVYRKQF
jgi:GNAT superfamily N-acetyltransferase